MYQTDNFDLYDGVGGRISVEIKDGCLEIFDHVFSGTMEIERWYNFDEKNTEHLMRLLIKNENHIRYLAENKRFIGFFRSSKYDKLREYFRENAYDEIFIEQVIDRIKENCFELLTEEDVDVKKIFLDNYSGIEGFERLKKLWKENDIEYKYNSWS